MVLSSIFFFFYIFRKDHKHTSVSQTKKDTQPSLSSKFISPSIERYFSSIENLTLEIQGSSSVSSDTFEPVPEPVIEQTPRGDSLAIRGKTAVGVKQQQADSGKKKNAAVQENSKESKQTSATLASVSLDESENDDLYAKVTSIVASSESQGLTDRLNRLGIDFHFLKAEARKNVQDARGKGCDVNISVVSGNEAMADSEHKEEHKVSECSKCKRKLNGFQGTVCSSCKSAAKAAIPIPSQCKDSPRIKQASAAAVVDNPLNESNEDTKREWLGISDSTDSTLVTDKGCRSLLPPHVQAQLQLNLRGSQDSNGTQKNARKSLDITSSISLEYSDNSVNPMKSLSRALQNELSLNLRDSMDSSVKSYTGAKSKKFDYKEPPAADKSPKASKNSRLTNNNNNTANNESYDVDEVVDDSIVDDAIEEEVESPGIVDEACQEFVQRLIADPRFRNADDADSSLAARPSSHGPQQSKSRSRIPANKTRPKSASYSRVKASVEAEAAPRRWKSSSTAWGTGGRCYEGSAF